VSYGEIVIGNEKLQEKYKNYPVGKNINKMPLRFL
jgi:hypothetical protein